MGALEQRYLNKLVLPPQLNTTFFGLFYFFLKNWFYSKVICAIILFAGWLLMKRNCWRGAALSLGFRVFNLHPIKVSVVAESCMIALAWAAELKNKASLPITPNLLLSSDTAPRSGLMSAKSQEPQGLFSVVNSPAGLFLAAGDSLQWDSFRQMQPQSFVFVPNESTKGKNKSAITKGTEWAQMRRWRIDTR